MQRAVIVARSAVENDATLSDVVVGCKIKIWWCNAMWNVV